MIWRKNGSTHRTSKAIGKMLSNTYNHQLPEWDVSESCRTREKRKLQDFPSDPDVHSHPLHRQRLSIRMRSKTSQIWICKPTWKLSSLDYERKRYLRLVHTSLDYLRVSCLVLAAHTVHPNQYAHHHEGNSEEDNTKDNANDDPFARLTLSIVFYQWADSSCDTP